MGLGDNLMATGLARGAAARGKRIAFGRAGGRTHWDQNSTEIFKLNPNIALPSTEHKEDVEWINFRTGHRGYNHLEGRNWIWNHDFKAIPGEMFFSEAEKEWASRVGNGFIVIEPNVPPNKSWSQNKVWPVSRYQAVAAELRNSFEVVQFRHNKSKYLLSGVRVIQTPTFRLALSVLSNAALYIGPEGGMHHGATAVGISAVVLFGGFIPPSVTGYDHHTNLTGGEHWFCGSLDLCPHCLAAMRRIYIGDVLTASIPYLVKREEVA